MLVIDGSCPGLVEAEGEERVLGDLFVLDDPEAAFARLDPQEGCGASGARPQGYERVAREVTREDGTRVEAWVYVYRADGRRWPRVPSGDWLASR